MWNPFAPKPAAKPVETVTLAEHRAVVDVLNEEVIRLRTERNNARSARNAERDAGIKKGRLAAELLNERDHARHILREINGMVTPACAGVGRKMAAKAREGLPEFAGEREAA